MPCYCRTPECTCCWKERGLEPNGKDAWMWGLKEGQWENKENWVPKKCEECGGLHLVKEEGGSVYSKK